MTEFVGPVAQAFLLVLATLFPIINPPGTALLFLAMTYREFESGAGLPGFAGCPLLGNPHSGLALDRQLRPDPFRHLAARAARCGRHRCLDDRLANVEQRQRQRARANAGPGERRWSILSIDNAADGRSGDDCGLHCARHGAAKRSQPARRLRPWRTSRGPRHCRPRLFLFPAFRQDRAGARCCRLRSILADLRVHSVVYRRPDLLDRFHRALGQPAAAIARDGDGRPRRVVRHWRERARSCRKIPQ